MLHNACVCGFLRQRGYRPPWQPIRRRRQQQVARCKPAQPSAASCGIVYTSAAQCKALRHRELL
eukprot:14131922-Alexandrium_andersonii.AAC.1